MNLSREFLILDYVFTRFRRSKLKWFGLFMLFTLVISFFGSLFFFSDALNHQVESLMQTSPDIVIQRQSAGRQINIDMSHLKSLSNIRGVSEAVGRLWGYYYDPALGSTYTVIAPNDQKPTDGTAKIGAGVARAWNMGKGDIISLIDFEGNPKPFRVKQILDSSSEMATADYFQINKKDFHLLFNFPQNEVTDMGLMVPQPAERPNVARKVKELLPDCRVVLKEDILNMYSMIFGWRTSIFTAILLVGLIALLIFCVDQMSGLWSGEAREVALLRAMGWTTTMVMRAKIYEVGAVVFFSYFVGASFAWLHIFLFNGGFLARALRGWSVIFSKSPLPPAVQAETLFLLFCLTAVPLLTVALIPIWKISNTEPEKFLR